MEECLTEDSEVLICLLLSRIKHEFGSGQSSKLDSIILKASLALTVLNSKVLTIQNAEVKKSVQLIESLHNLSVLCVVRSLEVFSQQVD
jgi:hypothetical protein